MPINKEVFLQKLIETNCPEQIINTITSSKKVAIVGHKEPDGDCINSQIAFSLGLQQLGIDVTLINEGPFNNIDIKKQKKLFTNEIRTNYDLFIVVDTPSKDRIGNLHKYIDYNKTIVIDHHQTNERFGKLNWVNSLFISASEMIFLIMIKLGINFRKTEIPQLLLNGVLADNGFFKHIRKDKYYSLLISYDLIDLGADPLLSFSNMYGNRTLNGKYLFADILKRIQVFKNGKVAWTYITDEDRNNHGNPFFDSSLIFSEMLSIRGVEVAIFFKKNHKNKNIDVSFRSRERVDIAKIAFHFGGGGHKLAAGASMNGDFSQVKENILNYVESLDF